jgi:hypothetical protein
VPLAEVGQIPAFGRFLPAGEKAREARSSKNALPIAAE